MALPLLDQWLVRRMRWPDRNTAPTPKQLRDWQLARLREIVTHAQANSPFYARHLDGCDPFAITSLNDFSRLPTITADHVRTAPKRLLCVSLDEIARVVTLTSSGTTGQPKRIFHTAEDLEATTDYFSWGMRNLVCTGQTVFVLMPGQRPGGVGSLLVEALERTGARAVPHGVMTDANAALDHCLAEDAHCLVGPASHINLLARAWENRGLPTGRIRSILLCWDATPEAVVRNAQNIFGCQVFRHWGMIETGLGGAVECAPGSGMHLRETDVFVEIVDSQTGQLLPDGNYGEMVVTTPLKRGMPLIRYRTGDMGCIIPDTCHCQSPMRRLDPQVYRRGDGVETGAGILTLQALNEALYSVPGLADFGAWFTNQTLRIVACGTGQHLTKKIDSALETIPTVRQARDADILEIEIVIRRDLAPVIPGLDKRRIQENQEN